MSDLALALIAVAVLAMSGLMFHYLKSVEDQTAAAGIAVGKLIAGAVMWCLVASIIIALP